MTNANIKLNVSDVPIVFSKLLHKVSAYKVFIFFLVVAALYGFIVFRVNTASNITASQADAQTAAQPHIDQATVDKIQSLQDNSVSVQALFDQARQNPFQE
jgi:phosphatidylserine decarboxylase